MGVVAKRGVHRDRPVQGALVCEGMAPGEVTEGNIADVFALWAERVRDLNEAIDAHNAGSFAEREGHPCRTR